MGSVGRVRRVRGRSIRVYPALFLVVHGHAHDRGIRRRVSDHRVGQSRRSRDDGRLRRHHRVADICCRREFHAAVAAVPRARGNEDARECHDVELPKALRRDSRARLRLGRGPRRRGGDGDSHRARPRVSETVIQHGHDHGRHERKRSRASRREERAPGDVGRVRREVCANARRARRARPAVVIRGPSRHARLSLTARPGDLEKRSVILRDGRGGGHIHRGRRAHRARERGQRERDTGTRRRSFRAAVGGWSVADAGREPGGERVGADFNFARRRRRRRRARLGRSAGRERRELGRVDDGGTRRRRSVREEIATEDDDDCVMKMDDHRRLLFSSAPSASASSSTARVAARSPSLNAPRLPSASAMSTSAADHFGLGTL